MSEELGPLIFRMKNYVKRKFGDLTEEEQKGLHDILQRWNSGNITNEDKEYLLLWSNYFKEYSQYIKQNPNAKRESIPVPSPIQTTTNVTGISNIEEPISPLRSRSGSVNTTSSNVNTGITNILEYIYKPKTVFNINRLRNASNSESGREKYQLTNKNIAKLSELFGKYDSKTLSYSEAETLLKYIESLDYFNNPPTDGGRRKGKAKKTRKAKKSKKAKKTRKH